MTNSKKKIAAKKAPTKKAAAKKAPARKIAAKKAPTKKAAAKKAPAKKVPAKKAAVKKSTVKSKIINPTDFDSFAKSFVPYKSSKTEKYMNKSQKKHFVNILNSWKYALESEQEKTEKLIQQDQSNFPDLSLIHI